MFLSPPLLDNTRDVDKGKVLRTCTASTVKMTMMLAVSNRRNNLRSSYRADHAAVAICGCDEKILPLRPVQSIITSHDSFMLCYILQHTLLILAGIFPCHAGWFRDMAD